MFKTREQALAYHRQWRAANPEKVKAAQKKYYGANREKRLANTRKWESENPEKLSVNRKKRRPKIKQWKKDNPGKVRAGYRRQRYGITPEQYEKMVQEQNNLCAICGNVETVVDYRTGELRSLSVDHDHETNKIRKLLCRRCNSGIGMFKDSVPLLQKVIAYLNEHKD